MLFENGDYALSMFLYWLVNFAFEDEEFPNHHTKELGDKAEKIFNQFLKNREKTSESGSYLQYMFITTIEYTIK